jgi:hypothetical protein
MAFRCTATGFHHGAAMDFHTYTTLREGCKRSGVAEDPAAFYRLAFNDAVKMGSGQTMPSDRSNS